MGGNIEENILLAIECLVYNHEPYLRACLEGIVNQRTGFRFVAIVHDDASTDGSADIIREYAVKYPEIIKPIFETENQYSKGNRSLARIMSEAVDEVGARFIAMCEGDDYWTDSYKLQKQVRVLLDNPSVTMVYTGFRVVLSDGAESVDTTFWDNLKNCSFTGFHFDRLLQNRNFLMTVTTVLRKEIALSDLYKEAPYSLDYALFLSAAACGDLYYLPEETSVYRINMSGMVQSNPVFVLTGVDEVRKYFAFRLLQGEVPEYCRARTCMPVSELAAITFKANLPLTRKFYSVRKNPRIYLEWFKILVRKLMS